MEATITMSVNGKFSEDDYDILGHEYQYRKSNLLDVIIAQQDSSEIDSLCGPSILVDPIVKIKEKQWDEIVKLACDIFHNPDIEGLRAILSAYAAHFITNERPVWIMVVGPPSTGKTALALDCLTNLHEVEAIDNITPKSIASGYGTRNGLLPMITHKHKGRCVLTMGDSGSMLGKNDYDLKEIAGIFRRIYDGTYRPVKGNQEDGPYWKGKITFVMAATEAMEKAWSVGRDLGERFVNIRWKSDVSIQGRLDAARYASRQVGDTERLDTLFKMIDAYIDIGRGNKSFLDCTIPENIQIVLEGLATLTGTLRAIVRWGGRDDREIMRVDDPEGSGRLTKVFSAEVMGSASLARRKYVNDSDVQLIKRISKDSIPKSRSLILQELCCMDNKNYGVDECKLREKVGITDKRFDRAIKELVALNAISRDDKAKEPGHWIIMRDDLFSLIQSVKW